MHYIDDLKLKLNLVKMKVACTLDGLVRPSPRRWEAIPKIFRGVGEYIRDLVTTM